MELEPRGICPAETVSVAIPSRKPLEAEAAAASDTPSNWEPAKNEIVPLGAEDPRLSEETTAESVTVEPCETEDLLTETEEKVAALVTVTVTFAAVLFSKLGSPE
jgi:hypothetical protein